LTCESERDDSSSGLNFRTAFFKMLQIRTWTRCYCLCVSLFHAI
jgi:hypothetical protein